MRLLKYDILSLDESSCDSSQEIINGGDLKLIIALIEAISCLDADQGRCPSIVTPSTYFGLGLRVDLAGWRKEV